MDKNLKLVGLSRDEILQQVKQEVSLATNYVQSRREQFRTRLALYNNQRKQRDKIGILTLYTTINTLLALNYTDELTVEFTGRDFGDSKLADNINNVAQFDQEEMNLAEINYFTQWDRFFYGVGLRDVSTFNTTTNTPIATTMSPLCWLPDPRGGIDPTGQRGGFRFYGFEVDRSKNEMTEERGFFNTDSVAVSNPNPEQQATINAENEAHGLNTQNQETDAKNKIIYQIDWYTMLKNESGGISKYLVTISSNVSELYRLEKIQPVTEEEKEDESLVPWPLVTNYYSPQRDNPFGTSVGDLVEDKQRAKSVLANLRINKEKASLYPMYVYNTQAIRNRRDLDFGFNKAVGVNMANMAPNARLADVLQTIQKDGNSNSTLNQEQSLDAEVNISTGADSMQAGVLSAQDRSATEVQQVALNAGTRFLLGYRINAWGEKRFWQLWYRLYRQYLSRTQEKIVRLQSGFSIRYTTITRKDFITSKDPDVTIISKTELNSRRDKERVYFAQLVPTLLQDPSKPAASRNFTLRYWLKLNGIKPDVISIMVPQSPDEQEAELENELLSRNIQATITLSQDHLTHMLIHSAAEDTNAKFAHIEGHRQAYVQSGQKARDDAFAMKQMSQQNGSMTSMQNSSNNALLNMQNRSSQPLEQAIQ